MLLIVSTLKVCVPALKWSRSKNGRWSVQDCVPTLERGNDQKARGMTEVAKKAGITREALYKALRPNASPRFDTISRVCQALGVRLEARPIQG